jgi:hypothetical protein
MRVFGSVSIARGSERANARETSEALLLADQTAAVKSFEVLPFEKVADAQAGAGGFGRVPEGESEANFRFRQQIPRSN